MVSPISRSAVTPLPPARTEKPGKSADSVGQQAKAAIADASATDLPRNIQGKVASLIARGLDYSSLLAPPAPPPAETGDGTTPPTGTSGDTTTPPPVDTSGDPATPPADTTGDGTTVTDNPPPPVVDDTPPPTGTAGDPADTPVDTSGTETPPPVPDLVLDPPPEETDPNAALTILAQIADQSA